MSQAAWRFLAVSCISAAVAVQCHADSGGPSGPCGELEQHRVGCSRGSGKACTSFLALFSRLLEERENASGLMAPAIWACQDSPAGGAEGGGFSRALNTLSTLESIEARRLFGSAALRQALSGETAEIFWADSERVARRLAVGPSEPSGPGPVLNTGIGVPFVAAKASSTRAEAGKEAMEPGLAFDGLAFTAWCSGGGASSQWIEFTKRVRSSQPFSGFRVVPGNARTQTSYLADGRPSRVRVSSCGHPEAAFEADLAPSDPQDFNEALVLVPVPSDALKGEANCVRFTILTTRPGRNPGVCISEIVPSW